MICVRPANYCPTYSMCSFLMWTAAFASRSTPSSSAPSWTSVWSTSFHVRGLGQVHALIIHCRMTFDLSRRPRGQRGRWGPRVRDAIIAHQERLLNRPLLSVPGLDQGFHEGTWWRTGSVGASMRAGPQTKPGPQQNFLFLLSLYTQRKHNCCYKSPSQQQV